MMSSFSFLIWRGTLAVLGNRLPIRPGARLFFVTQLGKYLPGAVWPVVETVQRKGQCAVVIAPAPNLSEETATSAQRLALSLAGELGVVGVMAVELFETPGVGPGFQVNELAMRPHNSGHWSMDGAVTGQFEQHVRAVAGLPLGDGTRHADVVMENLIGPDLDRLPALLREGAQVHLYGKAEVREGRKMGHVNRLPARA